MDPSLQETFPRLIAAVAGLSAVQSIGKSGGAQLPAANESDIDVFVFCRQIPAPQARQAAIRQIGDCVSQFQISTHEGRQWGVCDIVFLGETEVCLMYFTVERMAAEIDSVLRGDRLEKEENYFYPTGRCATFLSLHSLLDRQGFITEMQKKCARYPDSLAEKLATHHLRQLQDMEDLERAVARQDVFFYHFALDLALDHFLQALFALNRCFFPSRKRTGQYIEGFEWKPANCLERVANVVELGGKPGTLAQSYDLWKGLCRELEDQAGRFNQEVID